MNSIDVVYLSVYFPVCFSVCFSSLQYRYILESGEYRIAIGHDTDCRDQSWSQNKMCQSFELSLTSSYNPVCDEACSLLTNEGKKCLPEIFHSSFDAFNCLSLCRRQDWSWNYVECIEGSIINGKIL